jgi:hypothetical protein
MNCPTANQLAQTWYQTATPIPRPSDSLTPADRQQIQADRLTPAYQTTLEAYKAHRQNCPTCYATTSVTER